MYNNSQLISMANQVNNLLESAGKTQRIELTNEKRRYFLQAVTRGETANQVSKEYFCLNHTGNEIYNTLRGFIACLNLK